MDEKLTRKMESLTKWISSFHKIAVAFSGGVDSSFLLRAAVDAVGAQRVTAVTAKTVFMPLSESDEADALCRELGVKQVVCRIEVLSIDGVVNNPPDRCYRCKKGLFSAFLEKAREEGADVLAEGSNVDDMSDYRPGMRAIRELGVRSPLLEAGLTKREIRDLSKMLGLRTWDKPAYACLASRFAYGDELTPERLKMVEMAEDVIRGMGVGQLRVRIHPGGSGDEARIEVAEQQIGYLVRDERRRELCRRLRDIGFTRITLDLEGYRMGNLNADIQKQQGDV